MKCKKHPRYKAKRQPSSECLDCLRQYVQAQIDCTDDTIKDLGLETLDWLLECHRDELPPTVYQRGDGRWEALVPSQEIFNEFDTEAEAHKWLQEQIEKDK